MPISFSALRRFASMMLHSSTADPRVHRTVHLATQPLRGQLDALRSIYQAGKGVNPPAVETRAPGLARLRHRQRAAVFLTEVLRLDAADVAAILGVRTNQVETIVAAGTLRLHKSIGVFATREMLCVIRRDLIPSSELPARHEAAKEPAAPRIGRKLFDGFRRAVAMGAAAAIVMLSLTPAGASSLPTHEQMASSSETMLLPPLLMAR